MMWTVHCDCILTENEMEELIKCIPYLTRMNFRRYPGSENHNPTYCLNDGIKCKITMDAISDLTDFYYDVKFQGNKMTITS